LALKRECVENQKSVRERGGHDLHASMCISEGHGDAYVYTMCMCIHILVYTYTCIHERDFIYTSSCPSDIHMHACICISEGHEDVYI